MPLPLHIKYVIILLLLFPFLGKAQDKMNTFMHTYHAEGMNGGLYVENTSDSGFVVTGQHYVDAVESCNIYVVKRDKCGEIVFFKHYGTTPGGPIAPINSYQEGGTSVVPTNDGGFMVSYFSPGINTGTICGLGCFHAGLLKLNASGSIQWSKAYPLELGGSISELLNQTKQCTDNGYVAVASVFDWANAFRVHGYILKTDLNGTLQWSMQVSNGASENVRFKHVEQTADGGYLAIGKVSFAANLDLYYLTVVKFDANGNILWSKWYDTSSPKGESVNEDDFSVSATLTSDGGFITAVNSDKFGAGKDDILITKHDASGTIQWSKAYGGPEIDQPRCISKTKDGGYVVSGYTMSFGFGEQDVYLLKIDASGNLIWSKTYGSTQREKAEGVREIYDGGFILDGHSSSFLATPADVFDVYSLKTDSIGKIGCNETSPSTIVVNAPLIENTIVYTTTSNNREVNVVLNENNYTPNIQVLCETKNQTTAIFTSTGHCVNIPVQFTDSSKGNGGEIVYWQWDFGDGSPNVYTKNATHKYASSGTYTVTLTVESKYACKPEVATGTVTINSNAVNISSIPATCIDTCSGIAIVAPTNWVNPSVLWNNGATTLSISSLCAKTYSVTITDANGCKLDTNIVVTKQSGITVNPSSTNANCNQSNGSASVLASGGTPNTNGTYNYTWSNSATGATINNVKSGNYCVTVSDNNNCTAQSCITVAEIGGINASIQSKVQSTCYNNCSGTATAIATGGANYTYSWSNGQTNVTATGLCAQNYTVTITDDKSCVDTALVIITEPPQLSFSIQPPAAICKGKTATISATPTGGTGTYTYSWLPGNYTTSTINVTLLNNQTYTVSVTDANNCTSVTQTVTVNVGPAITVDATGLGGACAGKSVTLTAKALGGDNNYTYTWLPNLKNTDTINVTVTGKQTYTVQVNDGCGSPVAQDTISVFLNPTPNVQALLSMNDGCAPLCVNFTDNSSLKAGNVTSWLWDFGDGTTATTASPQHCYQQSGKYKPSLKVISDKNCEASLALIDTVNVYSTPTAGFTVDPKITTILNPSFNFTDKSIEDIINWKWDFGDPSDLSNTSNEINPSHTYSDTGTYRIRLIVTNANNCMDTIEQDVIITGDYAFYIPNAFSPNDDGINDSFNGKGIGIKKYEMLIFDRWGALIFKTTSLEKNWNGKANNGDEVAQQDVYVWMVVLTNIFDKTYRYIGHVTLVK